MSFHIAAEEGAIAECVLLPGDPLRAKYIAETFFTDSACYSTVRNMLGYTGFYKGNRVSVQSTGMGMPSLSIYSTELIEAYGAKKLIRVGSCGTISEKLDIGNLLIVSGADTDSGMNIDRFSHYQVAPVASFSLLNKAYKISEEREYKTIIGKVFTSDQFYDFNSDEKIKTAASLGALAVDMETAELYTLSLMKNIEALSILTVSDSMITGENLSSLEHQEIFDKMIDLALSVLF